MQGEISQGRKVLPVRQVQEYLRPPAVSVENGGEVRWAVLPSQPSAQQKEEEERGINSPVFSVVPKPREWLGHLERGPTPREGGWVLGPSGINSYHQWGDS